MRFSSFLAESHGADCPSKKLWKTENTKQRAGQMNYIVVCALKMRLRLKNAGIRTVAGRVRYSRIIIRHETERMAAPGELCQTASAIRAEAAGVALKPLPLRRSAGWSHRGGCLSASSEGLNQPVEGEKIKPAHHLQIKNCSAQITLMKYLSSLTGENFHSDGTPGTIKPNYENTSPLPVHRCSAGTGGAGSEQTSLARNTFVLWLFDSQLMHI